MGRRLMIDEIEQALMDLWQNCRIEPTCMGVSLGLLRSQRFGPPRPDVAQLMMMLVNEKDDVTVWFTANACWVKAADGRDISIYDGPVK